MKHKTITSVLMCKPLHFVELNYVINPWMMPGSINGEKALLQWQQLVDVYKNLGITVHVIDQEVGVPDMMFSADQGIVQGNKVLLSHFWHRERQKEIPYYKKWFEENGYEIEHLPSGAYFEGNGDTYLWKGKLIIGVGYRADEYSCDAISKALKIEVIPLHITDPKFYHLDMGFLLLDDKTAFYYPKAFDRKSREVLKSLIPNLFEFSKEEAYGFCANSIVTGRHFIHQKGNPTFQKKLKELGYTSIETDVSEFTKSGGGIHCLTNILNEV